MDISKLKGKLSLRTALVLAGRLGLFFDDTLELIDIPKIVEMEEEDAIKGDNSSGIMRMLYSMAKAEHAYPTPKNIKLDEENLKGPMCVFGDTISLRSSIKKDQIQEDLPELFGLDEVKVLSGLMDSEVIYKEEDEKTEYCPPMKNAIPGDGRQGRQSTQPTCEITLDWMKLAGLCSESMMENYNADKMKIIREQIINEIREIHPSMDINWSVNYCFKRLQIGTIDTCIHELALAHILDSLQALVSESEAIQIVVDLVVKKIRALFS